MRCDETLRQVRVGLTPGTRNRPDPTLRPQAAAILPPVIGHRGWENAKLTRAGFVAAEAGETALKHWTSPAGFGLCQAALHRPVRIRKAPAAPGSRVVPPLRFCK
ncbi:MAG: hypothetical protein INR71_08105 [Terriglobus roseus]|nr:hypothetical protein [Terriglobus roseus]